MAGDGRMDVNYGFEWALKALHRWGDNGIEGRTLLLARDPAVLTRLDSRAL